MTIPTSSLSLANLQSEFGGSTPISLSEYYAGGGLVPNPPPPSSYGAIPTSGAISLGVFRGVTAFTPVVISHPGLVYGVSGRQYAFSTFVSPNSGRVNTFNLSFDFEASGGAPAQGVGSYTFSYTFLGGASYPVTMNSSTGAFFVGDDLNATGYYRITVSDGYTSSSVDIQFSLWW